MDSWGLTASKADIAKIDKPLPIQKEVKGKGWAPYHGQYTHMICDEYVEAIDHPFIQDTWRPMWGDCYVIRTGDDRTPNRRLVNLWTLRMDKESYIAHREFYRYDYCWIPSLGQLMGVLVGRGMLAVVSPDRERGVWLALIVGKTLKEYRGDSPIAPEIALAVALRQLTTNLRMKL